MHIDTLFLDKVHDFLSRMDIAFPIDVRDVRIDRMRRNNKSFLDKLVRTAFREKKENFEFSLCKTVSLGNLVCLILEHVFGSGYGECSYSLVNPNYSI